MKEYLMTFEKDGKQVSIRRYLSDSRYLEAKAFVADGKLDRNGILLVSVEELTGITAKDFIPSIL